MPTGSYTARCVVEAQLTAKALTAWRVARSSSDSRWSMSSRSCAASGKSAIVRAYHAKKADLHLSNITMDVQQQRFAVSAGAT